MPFFSLASADITYEMLDGEIVAIDFVQGTYHSLRGAAAPAFAALVLGHPSEQATTWFTDPPAAAADELAALVARWQQAGLLTPRMGPPERPPAPPVAVAWASPAFETFDDMQQLLLADPIHDVGDGAWPREATVPKAGTE